MNMILTHIFIGFVKGKNILLEKLMEDWKIGINGDNLGVLYYLPDNQLLTPIFSNLKDLKLNLKVK